MKWTSLMVLFLRKSYLPASARVLSLEDWPALWWAEAALLRELSAEL
jgi:hypothetical protein